MKQIVALLGLALIATTRAGQTTAAAVHPLPV